MDVLRLDRRSLGSNSGIAVLTFNRPQSHNALTLDAMRQFAAMIDALSRDDSLRVLILTGAGEAAFCSGGDLTDLSQHPTADDGAAMITLMGDALLVLERLPVPVIAAINGYALGGGSEIALACDLRVIDERVQLGFVHLRRGLITGWGGGQRLMRLVGYARALEILLRAQSLKAAEILAFDLASAVVAPGQALPYALELAEQIAQKDAAAVRAVKAFLQAGLRQPYEQALQAERALFPALWTGATHRASMEQFLQRRGGRA